MFNIDVFKEFKFEPSLNRYRIVSGSGKGQFISKQAFLNSTQTYIDKMGSEMVDLGRRFTKGDLSVRDFQFEVAKRLKEIHSSQAILGANGIENMDGSRWLAVGRELKRQYYSGIDKDTGRKFGLKHLTEEFMKGEISEAQLLDRLKKYGNMGEISYWEQVRRNASYKRYAQRILGSAEHCEDCIRYAKLGVRPKSELPLPKTRCRCQANCKCSIVFLTLEEAIKRGYKSVT